MEINDINVMARNLRANRQFKDAYQLIVDETRKLQGHKVFAWEHQPIFWSDIEAGICKLTRRNGNDAAFIQELWRNHDFVYSLHRNAPAIPTNKQQLEEILGKRPIKSYCLDPA